MLQISKFDIVVACDRALGIGLDNQLPWRLSKDLKYFRDLTKGFSDEDQRLPADVVGTENSVIMGRNTWQSIPTKNRPLSDRLNIVLSHDIDKLGGTTDPSKIEFCDSFEGALQRAFVHSSGARCFVIGGAKVYEQAIVHDRCDRLYLTQIDATFGCDVFFPYFEDKFFLLSQSEAQEENGIPFSFRVYKRNAS